MLICWTSRTCCEWSN